MADETEVITATTVLSNAGTSRTANKSLQYTDTEVDSSDRTVRFWNKDTFSDTTNGKRRKVRFGIGVAGESGTPFWDNWDEYTSPNANALKQFSAAP